jgi:hypothetical protein
MVWIEHCPILGCDVIHCTKRTVSVHRHSTTASNSTCCHNDDDTAYTVDNFNWSPEMGTHCSVCGIKSQIKDTGPHCTINDRLLILSINTRDDVIREFAPSRIELIGPSHYCRVPSNAWGVGVVPNSYYSVSYDFMRGHMPGVARNYTNHGVSTSSNGYAPYMDAQHFSELKSTMLLAAAAYPE